MEPGNWAQVFIEFPDWHDAGRTAADHLLPDLVLAQAEGVIERWFFIRKSPCWRLRYAPAASRIGQILNDLAAVGKITGWVRGIYEPEELAFGGPAAMAIAHELFCADSHHVLNRIARCAAPPSSAFQLGERELGILLASVLMRGAGQDWYEQGDIWARVARHRRDDSLSVPSARREILAGAVRRLMAVDAGPASSLLATGPLTSLAGWFSAFDYAGQRLGDLAGGGGMDRGLRAVLTHHILFHFNRLGLTYADQSVLSALARDAGMTEPLTS